MHWIRADAGDHGIRLATYHFRHLHKGFVANHALKSRTIIG